MDAEIFRDQNAKTVVVFKRGHKLLHCLMIAPPVRVVKLEKHEERHFTPLLYKGAPYPVRRAVRRLKEAGRSLGITGGARDVLNELKKGT